MFTRQFRGWKNSDVNGGMMGRPKPKRMVKNQELEEFMKVKNKIRHRVEETWGFIVRRHYYSLGPSS